MVERWQIPTLPPNLTHACKQMDENYGSGDLEIIALVHGQNMEEAGKCRERHAGILEAFDAMRQANDLR